MPEALLEQYRKNFEYDYWATDKFVKALSEMTDPPEKALKLLSHILFASDVWLARLLKEDLSRFTDPNPSRSLAECRQKLEELHEKWRAYLADLDPSKMGEKFVYTNIQQGKKFEQITQNVLTHVVNHSSYHRGQLSSLVHQSGGNRPGTDYVLYALEMGEAKSL
jgi:uncharacterized damage-inducible protein DinB